MQIIFAGKAHPADEAGKHSVQEIYKRAVDPSFGGRVQLWRTTTSMSHIFWCRDVMFRECTTNPHEASGTSGMKASINGVIHLSVGDGWWAEGYTGSNGWLIEGGADDDDDSAKMNAAEQVVYRLLELEVVPTFYDRDKNGVPKGWLRIVRKPFAL